ncbi:MAG: hypothetical protein ABI873_19180 [Marmoricola sp.]
MTATLLIPTPTLGYEPVTPGIAVLEKPVNLSVGPVLLGGTPLAPVGLTASGYFTFRRATPSSPSEVWDSDHKAWVLDPAPDLAHLKATELAFTNQQWQGIVVAAGSTDAAGMPQFAKAVGGFPSYSFRAWFQTPTGSRGVSAPSVALGFVGVSDRNLLIVGPAEGEKAEDATEARLALKDTSLHELGSVRIRRDSPGAAVMISNAAGGSVVLRPDGSIELRPAGGTRVRVVGELEADALYFRPSPGSSPTRVVS